MELLIANCSPGPADGQNPQFGAIWLSILKLLGINCFRSNAPYGNPIDLTRAIAWTAFLLKNGASIVFDVQLNMDGSSNIYTARPTTAQIQAAMQAFASFIKEMIAKGMPANRIYIKGPNEPRKCVQGAGGVWSVTTQGDMWLGDPALFACLDTIYACLNSSMFPAGINIGSPGFFGGEQALGAMVSTYKALLGGAFKFVFLNDYSPNGYVPTDNAAQFASLSNYLVTTSLTLISSAFEGLPKILLETCPLFPAMFAPNAAFDPKTYATYYAAHDAALRSNIHLFGKGSWGINSAVQTQPTGNVQTDGFNLLDGTASSTGLELPAAVAALKAA